MAALTVSQQLTMIVREFARGGIALPPAEVRDYWALNDGQGDGPPYRRYYKTIADVVMALKRGAIQMVDVGSGSDRVSANQVMKNLESILKDAQGKIVELDEPTSDQSNFAALRPVLRDPL